MKCPRAATAARRAPACEWQLYLSETRLATYRSWPFTEGCMAEAGFIHCPSENGPDVVQCFFCFKELEGWEPEDDPLDEHRKHSSGCAFLSLRKNPVDLTLQEFLKLDKERTRNMIVCTAQNWGGGMVLGPALKAGDWT
uniref:Baculoviral IAP repeat containing 5 n=1 Tax=Chelonoidis abingdonii TaxID=106734 RepID=A0A8C0GPF1_CHEAB